jgi:hypothetical protein
MNEIQQIEETLTRELRIKERKIRSIQTQLEGLKNFIFNINHAYELPDPLKAAISEVLDNFGSPKRNRSKGPS